MVILDFGFSIVDSTADVDVAAFRGVFTPQALHNTAQGQRR
jgi:hypothetical protein